MAGEGQRQKFVRVAVKKGRLDIGIASAWLGDADLQVLHHALEVQPARCGIVVTVLLHGHATVTAMNPTRQKMLLQGCARRAGREVESKKKWEHT